MLCPGGGSGPPGSDGVAMPGEWSNDEFRPRVTGISARSCGSSRTSSAAWVVSTPSESSAIGRASDRGPRPRRPQQAREADRARRASRRADRVRARARPPHRVGRAARHQRPEHAGRHRAAAAPKCAYGSSSINIEAVGLRAEVRVVLVENDRELTGFAEGSVASVGATAARRRRRSRRGTSGRAGGRGDPHHQRGDQPHRQQPRRDRHRRLRRSAAASSSFRGRPSCAAIGTTPSPAALLDATNRRLAAPNAAELPADPSSRGLRANLARCRRSPSSSRTGSAGPTAWRSRPASGSGRCRSSASPCAASPASSTTSLRPDDIGLPFLAIDAARRSTPATRRELADAIAGADLVIVENLCSLPINPDASSLAATVLAAHEGRVVFHHHDLPWQRAGLADASRRAAAPTELAARHHQRPLARAARRTAASTRSPFATRSISIPHAANANATRAEFGFAPDDVVLLQPTRAIPRKNVPAAIEFAAELARANPIATSASGSPVRRKTATTTCSRACSPTSTVPVTVGRAA